jgi:cyclopropane-fatty-acyl-phospholipid synthase
MKRDETDLLGVPSGTEGTRTLTPAAAVQRTPGRKVFPVDKWLVRQLLGAAGNPPVCIILWDGQQVGPSGDEVMARVHIGNRIALLKLLLNPDLQFGELYMAGQVEMTGDLTACMEAMNRALPDFSARGFLSRLQARWYLLRRNTPVRAKDNIHHHYDIGNAFYKLWLDKEMAYTCAYFPDPTLSLEAAQLAKMEHICRKLQLQPGESVVEAGCGWGGLALYMAKHYGVHVKAYNISREQVTYARERAHREGLDRQVEFIQGDYREIRGVFDVFVSVGMLEHVGLAHYGELGSVIDCCLKGAGRGLIHSIGRNRPAPMNAWIEKRIFPGGYPPSLGEMMQIFEPWRFSVLDVENLRLHYAMTLRHWLDRYEAVVGQVANTFDPDFARAWRLYLAGSIAAFNCGELQLFQVVFTRYDNNKIPQSRQYMYSDATF